MTLTNVQELNQLATDIKVAGIHFDNLKFTIEMPLRDIRTFASGDYLKTKEFNFKGDNGVEIRMVNVDLKG